MPDDSEALVAHGYDAVYRAVPAAPTLWQIWREHAVGADFPDEFGHISFASVGDLRSLADALHLAADDMLVDLACGMGGPSLLVATQHNTSLTGVDASTVAVELARARAVRLGFAGRASFVVGTFADTGLADRHGDAVISLDALQYAPDKERAFREAARIMKPGGRLAFTAFEVVPERVADLPVLGDDPVDDYRPLVEAAGFAVDSYAETPGWHEKLSGAYTAILDQGSVLEREMGVEGFGALSLEGALTLEREPYRRRVRAIATHA